MRVSSLHREAPAIVPGFSFLMNNCNGERMNKGEREKNTKRDVNRRERNTKRDVTPKPPKLPRGPKGPGFAPENAGRRWCGLFGDTGF